MDNISNLLKKIVGLGASLASIYAIYWLVTQRGISIGREMAKATGGNVGNLNLQWGIIIGVALVTMSGLFLFGIYAVKGEFDHIEE